ncbi:MAG: ATP-binding cassette domain-containing protein, partial [Candidatus Bathyarchaeia archaeon]
MEDPRSFNVDFGRLRELVREAAEGRGLEGRGCLICNCNLDRYDTVANMNVDVQAAANILVEFDRWRKSHPHGLARVVIDEVSYLASASVALYSGDAFGLGIDEAKRFTIYDNVEFAITPRDIVYITGDSGSGKSILLKALEKDIKEDLGLSCININDIQPMPGKPLVETIGQNLEEALELLSRVGLNDAYLFLRSYEQLSEGQRYRWKLAKMIESKAQFWILDEFASMLDRDTAKIVAYNLQKLARQQGRAVLAATCHTDLFEDLNPSIHIHKRFGKEIRVTYHPNQPARECSLVREMRV